MEVTFYKLLEKQVSTWEAVRGKRTRIPGTVMALGKGGMPHDLLQLLVEGLLEMDRGFWGSVASGATFRSTGRKRTRPGRAVIAENRLAIEEAEHVAGDHLRRWMAGRATPCRAVLDEFDSRWKLLRDGEGAVVEWPTLTYLGTTRPASTQKGTKAIR